MGNSYNYLKLTGSAASDAVQCMKSEKVIPNDPTFGGKGTLDTITINETGQVFVNEISGNMEFTAGMSPVAGGRPAQAYTPEVEATGSVAETMRRKAQACALKSVGIAPP
jgi:hypothetical protein